MSDVKHPTHAGTLRRFKAYPAYKDSGVEWLGKVPTHWNVSRISEVTTLLNGYPFDSEYFMRGEGTPLVRIRDLNGVETEVNYSGPVIESAWIQPGDVIIGMDGDFNVARWRGQRALLNQRMCCLRPRGGTESGFIAYILPLPLQVINDLTYSTTVKHLSSGDVRQIRLGAPTEAEQLAIAAFLDRETERIDGLVANKERLIELLQEQRTALITRAVTKGLDPNVRMRNSGVEWLGEIPVHWEVKKAKRLFRQTKRQGHPDLTVLSVYRDFGVIEKSSRDDNFNRTPENLDVYQIVKLGDLVINKMKAWQGSLGVSSHSGITSPDYVVYAPSHAENGRFLHYFLRNKLLTNVYLTMSNGIRPSQWRLEPERFEGLSVFVPPLAEQERIADFLDHETSRIDALVAKVREAIDRLQELRTALISAAVTGKIDVREVATP